MTLSIIAQKKSAYKRVSLLENVDNTTWYLNAQNKRSAITSQYDYQFPRPFINLCWQNRYDNPLTASLEIITTSLRENV
jgi:hypothetical protein